MTRTSIESSARPPRPRASWPVAAGLASTSSSSASMAATMAGAGRWALPLGVAVVLVDEGAEGGHGFEAIAIGGGAAGRPRSCHPRRRRRRPARRCRPRRPRSRRPCCQPRRERSLCLGAVFHHSNFNWIVCPSVMRATLPDCEESNFHF